MPDQSKLIQIVAIVLMVIVFGIIVYRRKNK
jgi:LPXTG-motif cell wall-anchored protein